MYQVSEVFNAHMKADLRRVEARVTIGSHGPQDRPVANHHRQRASQCSYPQQTTDTVTQVTHKWASLDAPGAWTEPWHLAPRPG